MDDPLDIFQFEFTNSKVEENNEELVFVTLKDSQTVDLDQLYFENNQSHLYNVSFRAQIKDNSLFNSTVTMFFEFIDSNDNEALLMANNEFLQNGETINAILGASAPPNSPVSFNRPIRFTDKDFSEDFGIKSVNFKVC